MTPSLETRAIKLGSSIRDRSNWIKACDIDWERERESSVYVTPIGSELATPQGILHFTSLSFSLLVFGFCYGMWCGLWSETERVRALFLFELILSLSVFIIIQFICPCFFFFFFFLLYPLVCHCVGQLVLVSLSFFSVLWFVNLSN